MTDGVPDNKWYGWDISTFSDECDMLSFSFDELSPKCIGEIAKTNWVWITVPHRTNVASLVPTIEVSPQATVSPASGIAQNFSGTSSNNQSDLFHYTVRAQNGSATKHYYIRVSKKLSDEKNITLFVVTGAIRAKINEATQTISINVPHNKKLNLTALYAFIQLSPGATISPQDGNLTDFTKPVVYTVTAADGSTKTYTAIARRENNSPALKNGVINNQVINHPINTAFTIDLDSIFEDKDGDRITYNRHFNDGTNSDYASTLSNYSYTPTAIGKYDISFIANDGIEDTITPYNITLSVNNNPPNRISNIPATKNESIAVHTKYQLNLSTIFEDADNHNLTYLVSVDGASFSPVLKEYTFTPQSEGKTTHLFKAYDGVAESTDTYEVTLTATGSTNKRPSRKIGVLPQVSASIKLGQSYDVNLAAIFEDADNDSLTYKVKIGNDYFDVMNENYTYTPTQTGSVTLKFGAYDGKVYSLDSYSVNLTVESAPANTYTVTYHGNGNTGGTVPSDSSSPYNSGTTATILENTGELKKVGYKFNGWNTAKDGSGTDYKVDELVVISSDIILYAKWVVHALTGTVSITDDGTPQYGETLSADTSGMTNNTGTPRYQWKRGNIDIGTNSSSYTVGEADIGESITVVVTSDVQTGNITSGAVTPQKADYAGKVTDPLESRKTHSSITLEAVSGYEYSKDDGTRWQDSNVFTGLSTNKSYTFIQRVKESDTTNHSQASEAVIISTKSRSSARRARSNSVDNAVTIAENQKGDNTSIIFKQEEVEVTFKDEAFKELEKKKVHAKIKEVEKNELKLSDELKQQIGDLPIYDISVFVDGKKTQFESDAPIVIEIPIEGDYDNHKVVAVYIDENGDTEIMEGIVVDGVMRFKTNHLSNYALMYVNKTFDDILEHWGKEAIEVLASREIVKGRSETEFAPEGLITRAEYATLMVRYFNLEAVGTDVGYKDIEEGMWYTRNIRIARENGILPEIYGDIFEPDNAIIREDMMYMLFRSLEVSGRLDELTDNGDRLADFIDSGEVSGDAMKAIEYLISRDVINGSGNDKLDPIATSTRAEVAQMLYNMITMLYHK